MTDFNKLAASLVELACGSALLTTDEYNAAIEAARILRAAGAADVGGLMAMSDTSIVLACDYLMTHKESAKQKAVEHRAALELALRVAPTPKPQGGLWTLTAPDGRTYQADSPLRCCSLEQRQRVPADVAMARIFRAASEPDDSELLDWLDATNKRFKMGWKVGVAPAGNCSVQSIICLGNSELVNIRAAIRAAIAQERKA